MNSRLALYFVVATFAWSSLLSGQSTDSFFWSFQELGAGAVNSDTAGTLHVGEEASLFLYFDATQFDLRGLFVDVATTNPGTVSFTASETFDFQILVGDVPINYRWGDSFGPGTVSDDGQETSFSAFAVTNGTGILQANDGSGPLFDAGYDTEANAFLFARVDFVAEQIGQTQFDVSLPPPCQFIPNCPCATCNPVIPGVASVIITVVPEPGCGYLFAWIIFLGISRKRT